MSKETFNKTKLVGSIFVWLLSGAFSLFAIAIMMPIVMEELGYIPIHILVITFIPVSLGSIMLALTLLTELPKTKRFGL